MYKSFIIYIHTHTYINMFIYIVTCMYIYTHISNEDVYYSI